MMNELTPRNHGQKWSVLEVEILYNMLDRGYGYDAIAKKLERLPTAVEAKASRLNCTMSSRATVLNTKEIASLLGKCRDKSVIYWISKGWLKASVLRAVKRRTFRITWSNFMKFLRNENYWTEWHPEYITDFDLRAEMIKLRAGSPRWLKTSEVAALFYVNLKTVDKWIRSGVLQASLRRRKYYVRESYLENWRPPYEYRFESSSHSSENMTRRIHRKQGGATAERGGTEHRASCGAVLGS